MCVLYTGAKEKYGVDVGDHAIAENIVPCWECRYCLRGNYNMCEYRQLHPRHCTSVQYSRPSLIRTPLIQNLTNLNPHTNDSRSYFDAHLKEMVLVVRIMRVYYNVDVYLYFHCSSFGSVVFTGSPNNTTVSFNVTVLGAQRT